MTTANNEGIVHTGEETAEPKTQLQVFFNDTLKEMYWAEKYLVKAITKLQTAATTEQLQQVISNHVIQTYDHVLRLERVFEILSEKAQAKKNNAVEALINEGETVITKTQDGSMTRDAGLIVSIQKVEHYEIAVYGSLVQIARTMGLDEIARILGKTLTEEKEADRLLTEIAEIEINWEADHEGAAGRVRI
jgi:ferritin-like metal-binding protein YciE